MTADYLIYKYIKNILNNKYQIKSIYYKDFNEKQEVCAGVFNNILRQKRRGLSNGKAISYVETLTIKFNVSSYKDTILLGEENINSFVSDLLQVHNQIVKFDTEGNIVDDEQEYKYKIYIGQFDPIILKGYMGKNEFEIAQYSTKLNINFTMEVN